MFPFTKPFVRVSKMKFHVRTLALFSFIIFLNLALRIIQNRETEQQKQNSIQNFSTYLWQNRTFVTTINHFSSKNRLYFTRNIFDNFSGEIKSTIGQKIILFFNEPEYMRKLGKKDAVYKDCEYKNCIISHDKNKLSIANAVIFYIGIRNERMGKEPPINMKQRNPNQAWIFTTVEPPEHFYNADYRSKFWHNTMNWSSLYMLDSDIPNPYGCLVRTKELTSSDYDSVYNSKTRNALWMVSHCEVASARRRYVIEMTKNGFDVDILGGCGTDGRKVSMQEFAQIVPTYKFLLAFENSFCNDYISEKFFHHYNSSWIIVVRGGANYNRLLPYKTYINTADFSKVSTLVDFLSNLANDKDKYIEFLRNKDRYVSIRWPGNRNCEICRRLNNLSNYVKSYTTLDQYLTVNQCFQPSDS
ncbi:alpha-(1,3)-fucosyltransferase C-like [Mercenaria mercenaria]|uniref:alpha-(1,3)-fucosyltransferase C-like n=1 Tax=Mercenaria mercenaria TaxID=6596 RepID=UPI00234EFEB9|nr:alpha-(1,3)-fucosyltransferase C-like [Mercenaria mercenaria]